MYANVSEQQVDDHDRLDQADPPGLGARARHLARRAARPVARARRRCARRRPTSVAVDARAQLRRDVPFERTLTASPVAIPRRSASSGESSTSARRPLELELGDALDRGPEKSGAVADAARRPVAAPRGSAARRGAARRRARCGAQRRRARRARRRRGRRRSAPRARRRRAAACGESVDVEALGQLRDPGELVRARAG